MKYYIIVYKNTLNAMQAEKVLNEKKYHFKIMPTPTSITQSCGICTRFQSKDEIEKIINEDIIIYKNIYYRNSEGYKLIKEGE
ncbi:DUF3343 domain-containing protein [Clostridium vincentii]|uniref:Putative Se/S carrier protein-like domain-containing protein n=1 Tax=Clostridium vincentii TaxID=52704 RepID=A0A2T0BC43_9CLOT|nr:DUF3343 domain-containing protein [Clostridium vincentii]PRR81403.1 hypothetical protein CLVI_25260 [Clostridium vincentii]